MEYLAVPSQIKEQEYNGTLIMFGSPVLLCVPFLYDSDEILAMFILFALFILFILWYIADQHERRTDEHLYSLYGKRYKKMKQEIDSTTAENMMASLSAAKPPVF